MNDYLVLVPTTKNLVGITDIIVENSGVIPVVCISNELKALPISSDYKNFVQNPTGIIEKLTNESSYRIDLTEEVNSGTSWQLSFAIAHLLHRTNNLTFSLKNNLVNNASHIIWASGKLNANLDIIDVDHILSKIQISLPLIKKANQNNKKVFICVGKKNYKELYEFFNKTGFLKNIEILSLNNLKDLSSHIDINIVSRLKKTYNFKFLKSLIILSVILILSSVFYMGLKISDNLNKYNQMVSKENFLIEINRDRNSTDFFRSFTAFLFSYIQNFERLHKSDFLKVKFITFSSDRTKKYCSMSDKEAKLSINASCKFFIEVSNISKKKLFVWIYKKNNFQTSLPLERSILASNEKLIIENPKKGFKRLIFVFGENLNNEVEEKLNNMRLYKNNIKIENQLERFSTLGYGYKVYEFFNKISIERIN